MPRRNRSAGTAHFSPLLVFRGVIRAGTAVFMLLVLLVSCEWIYGPVVETPANITVTTGKYDKIILSWDPVPNADIYYIYRSPEEDGEYVYYGFSYTAAFTDTGIDPEVPYWYRVTASDLQSNNESPRTAAVEGDSLHEFAWSGTAVLSETSASQIRVAADRGFETGPDGPYRAWAVLAGNSPDTAAEVYGYDEETETWEAAGAPFGSIDPAVPGSVDIAAHGGDVYAAFADTGISGRITVKTYDPSADDWTDLGAPGITGTDNARYISLEADPAAGGVELVWVRWEAGSYAVMSVVYDGTAGTWGPAAVVENSSGGPYRGISTVRLDAGLFAAFEDEDGGIADERLKVKRYNGTAETWEAEPPDTGLPPDTEDIRDGYFTLTGLSAAELYMAYMTGASEFSVRRYDGTGWNTPVTPGTITVEPAGNGVGLTAESTADGKSYLYLFYREGINGYVRKKDISGGPDAPWEVLPVSSETEGMSATPASPDIDVHNNIVYCGYLSGSSPQVRIWR